MVDARTACCHTTKFCTPGWDVGMHVEIHIISDYFVCYYPSLATATQIVVPPQSQTVPVNSVARFTCRTTAFVVWQINNAQLISDSPTSVANAFQLRGIGVDSDNDSVLLVNATLENNGTNVTCLTGPDCTRLNVMSTTAILTVFGES